MSFSVSPLDLPYTFSVVMTIPSATQLSLFYDTPTPSHSSSEGGGGFFATARDAPHVILRLKDGMDTSEPSTNGTSATNLFRLGSLLANDTYTQRAKETIAAFEAEILQYPWGFGSFLPGVVAGKLGVKSVVVLDGGEPGCSAGISREREGVAGVTTTRAAAAAARGGLAVSARLQESRSAWIRERNPLLRNAAFPKDGKPKIMICENGGECREEGVAARCDDTVPEPGPAAVRGECENP
jgi:uncharacterized protein YyaL (SSP411 family)